MCSVVEQKMTSFSRFDSIQRTQEVPTPPESTFNGRSWKIVGGLSYYYGNRVNEYWVHVPNGYVTQGPVVPSWMRRKLTPTHPVFKAGILHDYLRNQGKIKKRCKKEQISQNQADLLFLEAMKVSGVPWPVRTLAFVMCKFTCTKNDE